jgi:RHS repeat-associated protein
MLMPGRSYNSAEYRYGFNGKEKDDEVKGSGAQYDYGFRIYEPRLGKFLSVDPLFKSYPWYTPYQFAGNKPIVAIDLDGKEEYVVILDYSTNKEKPVMSIYFDKDAIPLGNKQVYVQKQYSGGAATRNVGELQFQSVESKPTTNKGFLAKVGEWISDHFPNFVGYNMPGDGGTRESGKVNSKAPTLYVDGQLMKDLAALLPLADFKGDKFGGQAPKKESSDGGRTYRLPESEGLGNKILEGWMLADDVKETYNEVNGSKKDPDTLLCPCGTKIPMNQKPEKHHLGETEGYDTIKAKPRR